MEKKAKQYYLTLAGLIKDIAVTGKKGDVLTLAHGLASAVSLIGGCGKRDRKLIFIGNGASASISSHMAADFWKNGKIRAIAFNDPALLTSVSNDFGYEHVFEKPIEMFADKGDIVIAISSSGNSRNIVRGVRMAIAKGCKVISLSGFKKNNALRNLGEINFYVPFSAYGQVEVIHHSICHCMLDMIASKRASSKCLKK